MTTTVDFSAIREKLNTSSLSEAANTPTPLATFLAIYNKAGREGYNDYMQGAKALYKYLSPIIIPVIPEADKLPDTMPAIFHGYEVNQLVAILAPIDKQDSIENWLEYAAIVRKTIIYLTLTEYLNLI